MRKATAAKLFSGNGDEGQASPERFTLSVEKAVREYVSCLNKIDAIKAELSEVKNIRQRLSEAIIANMEGSDLKSVKLIDGLLATVVKETRYTLPPKSSGDLRRRVLAWMKRVRLGDAIEPWVHHSTFNALMNERRDRGLPVIEEVNHLTGKTLQVRGRKGHDVKGD